MNSQNSTYQNRQNSKRTPIANQDEKLDIIEHIHQDHPKELLVIAKNYYPDYFSSGQFKHAQIVDIYQEGILLKLSKQVQTDNADDNQVNQAEQTENEQDVFIEFELEGDLEEQILYLAYVSMIKQGEEFGEGNKKQFFTVIGKQQLSKNMIRLTIKSDTPLPINYAGYAYGFVLKTLGRKNNNLHQNSQSSDNKLLALAKLKGLSKLKDNLPNLSNLPTPPDWLTQKFNMGLLQLMKRLSSENRQRLFATLNKDTRVYTLRSAFKSSADSQFLDMGYVDVFVHGGSAGSRWIDGLQLGDIISSRNQTSDRHEHLAKGQAVLIADETAYPAVAGILETWQNPIPPHLIVISSDKEEQSYFVENHFAENSSVNGIGQNLPENLKSISIHRIICPNTEQGKQVIEVLKTLDNIEVSWGALENNGAKQVRHYLRNERKLTGKNNRIKGYWRLDK
ncbi:siderophore-interacting protein [Psychrobacter sp. I-STPA10]|uniref:siderophore-interacting protein n=1 Tax=Psychrobacter sp. I-STPA10 TaxID=2585769 RepID=UPI001E48255D|nr:siderophore-interacting protein [Psychrobacter sp. I-STPA10]